MRGRYSNMSEEARNKLSLLNTNKPHPISEETKKKILSKLSAIGTTITLFAIKANMVFAAETGGSGIGTAEVQTATENIKRVITSIAMPLRWCSNFCKCSSCSN